MVDIGQTNGLGEVPLRVTADRKLGANKRRERFDPLSHAGLLPADYNHSVGFQITDVAATFGVEGVHNWRVGEVTVEGEVARYVLSDNPIDQFLSEVGVILERALVVALLALAEAPEIERIMLPTRVDVVGKQVIVGDQVAFVGMVPEIADILYQFAVMIYQSVIDRDNAVVTIARCSVLLKPFEPVRVDALDIPGRFSQPSIESGLVGWGGKLSRDTAHGLVLRYKQPGQVFGKVAA